jgi:hypothetical protein
MSKKTESKEVTVVAELTVTWVGGSAVVKSFDKAWHLALDKAREGLCPVQQSFNGWVRKD